MSSLPLGQQQALAIIPKITGVLSALLSGLTTFVICRDPHKRCKVYHRLILGMSLADISSSLWLSLSTWPIPAETNVLWAVGTTASCNVQGFFTQFGISSPLYNSSLALYYVLAVRYGWKEIQLHSIEIWFHVLPVGWALITAIAGLPLEIFNSANLWCWIANDPAGVRNTSTDVYRWALFYGPLWLAIVFVTICLVVVFAYVRSVTLKSERYSSIHIKQQPRREPNSEQMHESEQKNHRTTSNGKLDESTNKTVRINDNTSLAEVSEEKVEKCTMQLGEVDVNDSGNGNQQTNGKSDSRHHSIAFSTRLTSFASSMSPKTRNGTATRQFAKRRREVAFQCLRYALAFYWTWIPISLLRILQTTGARPVYALFFLAAMNTPFQGLPNCLVFLYPLYQKARKANPNSNFVKVVRLSLAPADVSKLPHSSSVDVEGEDGDAT
jgi:G protein-coupled glucose receptor regulating Gpa2